MLYDSMVSQRCRSPCKGRCLSRAILPKAFTLSMLFKSSWNFTAASFMFKRGIYDACCWLSDTSSHRARSPSYHHFAKHLHVDSPSP